MRCSQNINGTIVAGFFAVMIQRGAKNEPRNQFYFYKSNLAAKQQFFLQREQCNGLLIHVALVSYVDVRGTAGRDKCKQR